MTRHSARFSRTASPSTMLPFPSVARSRVCGPSVRHPRITTVAAVLLLVACIYHTRGFRTATPPVVGRASVLPDALKQEELIADGEGGQRMDDTEREGAIAPLMQPDAPASEPVAVVRDVPTTAEEASAASENDIVRDVESHEDASPLIAPTEGETVDTAVEKDAAPVTAPIEGETVETAVEKDAAPVIAPVEGETVDTVVEKDAVDTSVSTGPDVVPTDDRMHEDTVVPAPALDTSDKVETEPSTVQPEGIETFEKVETEETVGNGPIETGAEGGAGGESEHIYAAEKLENEQSVGGEPLDAVEKVEENASAGDPAIDAADKQEHLNQDEAHGDTIESADRQQEAGDEDSATVAGTDSAAVIHEEEPHVENQVLAQIEKQAEEGVVPGETVPETEKQVEEGPSLDTAEREQNSAEGEGDGFTEDVGGGEGTLGEDHQE
ncbi:unnamed protein product [Chondrus crispus]|uniref:Uncharacterized protein n=1 Tax=Chondrus crispus TaxID=2769 RepID=R7QP31_CHOCR|nr:unnamed protein product [Chondrus crispus]CDF39145.1 unnamed protein product [Chondrus crispus]|eukprot:XP_005719056.1 unnamed protein product [Chondrus crispus]